MTAANNTGIPVSPEMLKWGRETLGLTLEQAAQQLDDRKVSAEVIASWESGAQYPTYDQLEALSYEVYKRPLALFFFPAPPHETPITELLPAAAPEIVSRLGSAARLAIRAGVVYHLSLQELFLGGQLGPRKIWEEVQPAQLEPTGAAQHIFTQLGEPPASPGDFRAFKVLLEKSGIAVFEHELTSAGLGGFNLFYRDFPIIVVNNRRDNRDKLFYLFYGLVNTLYKQGGIWADPEAIPDLAEINLSQPARRKIAEQLIKRYAVTGNPGDENYTAEKFYRQQSLNLSPAYLDRVLTEYARERLDKVKCADYLNIMPRELDDFLDCVPDY